MLPAVVIVSVVIIVQRTIAYCAFKNQKVEKYAQGNISLIIKDSMIDKKVMLKVRLTEDRLMAQFLFRGIRHLGQVKRLYLEVNGSFTLIKEEHPIPGLSVIPDFVRIPFAAK